MKKEQKISKKLITKKINTVRIYCSGGDKQYVIGEKIGTAKVTSINVVSDVITVNFSDGEYVTMHKLPYALLYK